MPELPEVEGFRRLAEDHLLGRRIRRARFLDDWMLKDTTPFEAARRLRGHRVSSVDRRGKVLAIFTEPERRRREAPVVALHFGMTGRPILETPGAPLHPWDRAVLELDDGVEFRYRNSRRLGYVRVITRHEMADLAWRLGPDALEADLAYVADGLRSRQAAVKAVLLDQSFLAGVGNIYADEALFAAGIDPRRPASSLEREEAERVHRALRRIIARAAAAQRAGRDRTFPLLAVRGHASRQLGRSGSPKVACPRCSRPLRAARLAGRTSFFCPSCQR